MQRFTLSPSLHSTLGLIEPPPRLRQSNPLDDGGKALADADAQADESPPPATSLQLAHGGQREPRARGPQRVADGDGAAIRVNAAVVERQAQQLQAAEHLRGEGL